jgi:GGDEF domain-containing protein
MRMAAERTVLYYGPGSRDPSPLVSRFAQENDLVVQRLERPDEARALLNRGFPACVILEIGEGHEEILDLSRSLKQDTFTAIVPLVILVPEGKSGLAGECLEAGADEVVHQGFPGTEKVLRLQQVLRRADRDVSVHPTTRLPGTSHIARDMAWRLESGDLFAVCYADLDHFKEFNDRYGYTFGDGVIKILSRILRDMVRGLAPGGFVGHIGGDDFIFIVPLEYMETTCDAIIELFDELIPYQYTEEDRRAGYFLGKDRRGHIHRIPLMTLSIGIVTNQLQGFQHTGQISELAAEMKNYAKTLPGSLYVVDRRRQLPESDTTAAVDAERRARPEKVVPAKSNA